MYICYTLLYNIRISICAKKFIKIRITNVFQYITAVLQGEYTDKCTLIK